MKILEESKSVTVKPASDKVMRISKIKNASGSSYHLAYPDKDVFCSQADIDQYFSTEERKFLRQILNTINE